MDNIVLEKIEIMPSDLPNKMSWTDAQLEIENSYSGGGWRLPYEEEFLEIYNLHKLGFGRFKPSRYWSSSSYLDKAWYYDLRVGYSPHIIDKTNKYYIRLVRDIK